VNLVNSFAMSTNKILNCKWRKDNVSGTDLIDVERSTDEVIFSKNYLNVHDFEEFIQNPLISF